MDRWNIRFSEEERKIGCVWVYLVELLIEVGELTGVAHDFLTHEERGVNGSIALLHKELLAEALQSLHENHTVVLQEVTTLTCYLLA